MIEAVIKQIIADERIDRAFRVGVELGFQDWLELALQERNRRFHEEQTKKVDHGTGSSND